MESDYSIDPPLVLEKHFKNVPHLPRSPKAGDRLSVLPFGLIGCSRSITQIIRSGASLHDIFRSVCTLIEHEAWDARCSISLHDGANRGYVVAPSLPEDIVGMMNSTLLESEDYAAAFKSPTHDSVIVSHVEHERWQCQRSRVQEHQIQSYWAYSIRSSSGNRLGILGMYFRSPRVPDGEEEVLLSLYSHLLGIAVDAAQSGSALRHHPSRFQRVLESSGLIPWEARYDTWQITYIGLQARNLLGYSEEQWAADHAWEDFIHPEDREWVTSYCRETAKQQPDFSLEYRLQAADGRTVWVHDLVSVIHDHDGQPTMLQGFFLDMTKQKETETAIQKSEERLQAILDHSPALVFVKDPQGQYLMVNCQWENRFSLSRRDVLGKTVHEIFPKDTADNLLANDRHVYEKKAPVEFEERIPLEDGVHTYLSIKFPVPAFNEEGTSICGIATDITDRKRTEHLLQAQNTVLELLVGGEPLQTVLEKLCVLIAELCTGAFCTVLLLEKDGKTLRLEAAPHLPAEFRKAITELKIGEFNGSCGAAAFHGRQVIVPDVRKDPSTQAFAGFAMEHGICACWSTPFFGRDGKVLGSFGICHPVPCSPSSYDQHLMATAAHLASIVCERQRTDQALQESETRLRQSQKMEAIGTLAGGIAHDFNNMLTAILGFNELARSFLPDTSPIYRYLEEVHAAGIRAKGLTKQILVFSRQTDQELKPIHLPQVIEEALRFLRATLPSTLEIMTTLNENVNPIIADPVQIHQVLMNLCTNAAQAIGENGGMLEVCLESIHLTDEEIRQFVLNVEMTKRSYLKLTIRDTGPGISPDILDRIFDPFFTTKQAGDGVGLGLSVVHGIVSNHGGGIKVESTLGQGTMFTIFLPELPISSIQERSNELPLQLGAGERILFIEDEESIAHLGEQILRQLGYTVTVETQSIKALEVFREKSEHFDLVITDQTMPNMTGEVLSQELLGIRPDIPIILCTGYSPSMTPEKAKKLGIRAFLWKPLLLHDLSHTIHQVLSS